MKSDIKNPQELEFAIFCIENIAIKLKVAADKVYEVLLASDILNGYIIPEYEILHTQSKEYIIQDILDVMKERNVEI